MYKYKQLKYTVDNFLLIACIITKEEANKGMQKKGDKKT